MAEKKKKKKNLAEALTQTFETIRGSGKKVSPEDAANIAEAFKKKKKPKY